MEKKKSLKLILLALGCMTFTSCAGLLQNRTFIDEMDRESDGLFVAGRDFDAVPGDSGSAYRSNDEIRMRTPASESEACSDNTCTKRSK